MLEENIEITLKDKQRFDNDISVKINTEAKSIYIPKELNQKYLKVFKEYYSDFILLNHFRQKHSELLDLNIYFSDKFYGKEVMDKIKELVSYQKCTFHQMHIFNLNDK